MNWQSWSEFAYMGGYGLFVWGSYGLAVLLIALEVMALRQGRRHALRRLRAWATERGGNGDQP